MASIHSGSIDKATVTATGEMRSVEVTALFEPDLRAILAVLDHVRGRPEARPT